MIVVFAQAVGSSPSGRFDGIMSGEILEYYHPQHIDSRVVSLGAVWHPQDYYNPRVYERKDERSLRKQN